MLFVAYIAHIGLVNVACFCHVGLQVVHLIIIFSDILVTVLH